MSDAILKKLFSLFPQEDEFDKNQTKEDVCRRFRLSDEDFEEFIKEMEKKGLIQRINRDRFKLL